MDGQTDADENNIASSHTSYMQAVTIYMYIDEKVAPGLKTLTHKEFDTAFK
jgi:hypothetical protein